jgi:hypothetical protein
MDRLRTPLAALDAKRLRNCSAWWVQAPSPRVWSGCGICGQHQHAGLTDRTQIPVGASLLAMGPGQAHRWWLVYRYREQARSHRYFSVFGPLVLGHASAWLTHRRPLLWRGSLLPLGCAAAPNHAARWVRLIEVNLIGAASQPSGDKSPRHTSSFSTRGLYLDG